MAPKETICIFFSELKFCDINSILSVMLVMYFCRNKLILPMEFWRYMEGAPPKIESRGTQKYIKGVDIMDMDKEVTS